MPSVEGELAGLARVERAPSRRRAAPAPGGGPTRSGIADVELHHLATRRGRRCWPRATRTSAALAGRRSAPAATGVADRPGRVAEPEAERERRLDAAGVVPAVPGEDALLVAEHAGFGVSRKTGVSSSRAGIVHGSRPPGSASPKSTSATRPAALLARQPAPEQPPAPIAAHDRSTGEPATTDHDRAGLDGGHRLDELDLAARAGRATSRSRPSVSQSSSRPTTTTATSASRGGGHRPLEGVRRLGRRAPQLGGQALPRVVAARHQLERDRARPPSARPRRRPARRRR